MKMHPIFASFLPGLMLMFPAQVFGAETVSPVSLRYTAQAGQTNVYRVEIEAQGESGREVVTGTVLVSSREVAPNLIGLTFRGQLRPKPMQGMPAIPFYRPGGPPTLMNLFSGPPMEAKELVIRPDGRLVRQAGDIALPVPLGQWAGSLIQSYPGEAFAGTEEEKEVMIFDEPLLMGPLSGPGAAPGSYPMMSYYPGRVPQGVLAATQKSRMRVTAATAETVTLQKTVALDSLMLTGTEPRVSASSQGEIVVDRASGWPKRIDMQCKTVAVTENSSRRSVLALRWQLVEGAERDAALAPPPPPRPVEAKVAETDLPKLMERLESEDTFTRELAARELSNAKWEPLPPDVARLAVKLAGDQNSSVRQCALTVLANYGAKEHVPLLLKALNQPDDASTRLTVAKGLGRLQDPRAAEPLAEMLAEGATESSRYRGDNQVVEALTRLGPAAEPAVLALFKEKSLDTRISACRVLKVIGTKKSLPTLKDLTTHPNKELSEAAAEACRSIQAR